MLVSPNGARSVLAMAAGVATLGCAACGGGGNAAGASNANKSENAAAVKIMPANGTATARPDRPVIVQATGGRLDNVTVTVAGRRLAGDFNADHTQWQSTWMLRPGANVVVRADAKNAHGEPATATSNFTTQRAGRTFSVAQDPILESNRGHTYGIGLPIILTFDRRIENKAAVERALEVRAEKPVEGAWRWIGDREVIYRTRTYWPAHQTVSLIAHLSGVQGGRNAYGMRDFSRTYRIGRAQVSHLNLARHMMRVTWDGKPVRRIAISAGNGSTSEYTTTSGPLMTMEKNSSVVMTSPGRGPGDAGYYSELIHYAVRITGMGEYLHQTPGQEGCLGHSNCSHGCVRQSAGNAKWFYRHAQPADPVLSTGSDRQVGWDDGWSFFQMPFDKWRKGSALR